jgi:hypothetical protein
MESAGIAPSPSGWKPDILLLDDARIDKIWVRLALTTDGGCSSAPIYFSIQIVYDADGTCTHTVRFEGPVTYC